MAGYHAIVGHEETVEHLKTAVSSGKVSHAYLIEGAVGSGKMMIAEAFAAALLCEKGGRESCGQCHSCHQAKGKNHPDIIYVTHEKPSLISVDEIRDQLVSDVAVRPYYGGYKVYIVEDAQLMNPQAQNAILKTLEEPPEYAVILLLTVNSESLLDTIRSRCVRLPLRPVKTKLVVSYLMEHQTLPDYQAKLCAAFAQGSIGKALSLAASEDFAQIRANALTLVHRSREMDMSHILAQVKEVSAYKLSIQDFLDLVSVWFRDVLYFKATQDADSLIFRDDLQQIRSRAEKSSYEGLEEIMRALEKARARLDANVGFDITMELLFLTIKEN